MNITFLKPYASPKHQFHKGATADVDAKTAARWIKRGYCKEVAALKPVPAVAKAAPVAPAPPKPTPAVAPSVKITQADLTELTRVVTNTAVAPAKPKA